MSDQSDPNAQARSDSVGPEYATVRGNAARGGDSWIRELAAGQQGGQQPQAGPQAAPAPQGPQPSAPAPQAAPAPSAGPQRPQPQPQPSGGGSPTGFDHASFGGIGGFMMGINSPVGAKILGAAHAVGADLAKGLPEVPGQILGGALDAFNNINKFAVKATDQLDKLGVPNAYVQFTNKQGKWDPRVLTPEQFHALGPQNEAHAGIMLPTTGPAHAVSSQIVRSATSFLVGRGRSGSAIGSLPEVLRDFAGGALTSDPNQPRLSNIIDKVAPNFVTRWLKADPKDEDSLLGNLKSGLEYAGLGTVFGAAKAGLSWLKGVAIPDGAPEAGAAPPGGVPAPEVPEAPEAPGAPGEPPPAAAAGAPPPEGAEPQIPPAAPEGAEGAAPAESITDRLTPTPADQILDAHGLKLTPEEEARGTGGLENMEEGEEFQQSDAARAAAQAQHEDLVKMSPDIEQKAQQFLDGKIGENPAWININRLNGEEDVDQAVGQLKEALARTVTYTNPIGVQSHDTTRFLANSLGMTPDDLLAGYKARGTALSADEIDAMRMIVNSSATQLTDYANSLRGAGYDANSPEMAQFLRAFSTHSSIMQYAMGARAESARALNAWGMVAGDGDQYAKAIQNIVNDVGPQDIEKLASQISDLKDPDLVSKYVGLSNKMTGRDAIMYGFNNLLLSNPRTVVKKVISDTTMAFWNVATRYTAEQSPVGMSGDIPPGEAAQLAYGYVSSIKDGIKLAGKSLSEGGHQFLAYDTMDWKDAASRLSTLTEGAPDALNPEEPTKNFADVMKMFLPTRWIGATDDFAKYVNYRAELRALAYRSGISQGLAAGSDEIGDHISNLMDNVPQDLHQQAVAAALRNTFQEPLSGASAKFQELMDSLNLDVPHTGLQVPVGRIITPFIKVPFNIMKFAYRNSPVAMAFPSEALNAELSGGGAVRDVALAKIALGTAVSLSAADLALSGTITGRGPSNFDANQAWRRAGNEPYSFRVGDKWYGYNSLEPFGLIMGTIADTFGTARYATQNKGVEQMATSLAFGLGNAFLSKTYMSGLSNFFDALQNPDADAKSYTDRLITSLTVPQGAQGLRSALDPWMRSHYDLLSTWQGAWPYASEGQPPARTLWGDPIPREQGFLPPFTGTGLARMISPVPVASATGAEPIDKWVWENKDFFPQSPSGKVGLDPASRTFGWAVGPLRASLQLSPQQYDHLRVLAGNGLKDPATGFGAKDALNAMVGGKFPDQAQQTWWNQAAPSARALWVLGTWGKYQAAAKRQMLVDDPGLRDQIEQALQQRAQQLQGAPQ